MNFVFFCYFLKKHALYFVFRADDEPQQFFNTQAYLAYTANGLQRETVQNPDGSQQ